MDVPKRPELFVRACVQAARERPLRGVMLGGGPRLDEVRSLVEREAAPVDVLGESDAIAMHLAGARALCLFSDFEGVPFAVQEAMWAGRPVVVSPLPGLRWFAGEAADYAEDADSAAAALVRLCDLGVAATRAAAAAARAHQVLSPHAPFPALMAAYAADSMGTRL
jgi:glycosyltransferase involved in cell wall biosynthesis